MQNRPTVVITGASAGVGRATARAFGRRGWNVALLARGEAGLRAAAAEVEQAGGAALVLPTDVADAEAVFRAAEATVERWGAIDVWINNAMATLFAPVERISPEEFARVTQVTYLGTVHGAMAALRHMRPRDRGRIVQIGSALAYRAIPLQSAYCGAKAAARNFTNALRSELLHDRSRIRVTMVHLPAVNTPQFDWARSHTGGAPQPVPPIHAPGPIAEAIFEAARDCPRELWVGAPTFQTILGETVAPGLMDRMMARAAYESQVDEDMAAGRPDNLFTPVDRDMGAEGRFGDRAKDHALSLSGRMARGGVLAAGIGATTGLALATAAAWRRRG